MKFATLANLRKLRELLFGEIVPLVNSGVSTQEQSDVDIIYVQTYSDLANEEPNTDALYVVIDSQIAYRCVESISDNIVTYKYERVLGYNSDESNIIIIGNFEKVSTELEKYRSTRGYNVLQIDLSDATNPVETAYSFYVIARGSRAGGQELRTDLTIRKRSWSSLGLFGFRFSDWRVTEIQERVIAGENIIVGADNKTISAVDTVYSAGDNIEIDSNNRISAIVPEVTEYVAGENVEITDNQNGTKTINATDTVYSAGDNIEIDSNNRISAVVGDGNVNDVDALHYGVNNFYEHGNRDVIINGNKTIDDGQNDLRITSDRAELNMTSNKLSRDAYDGENNHIVEFQGGVSQLTHDKILFEKKTLQSINGGGVEEVEYTRYKQTQQDIELEASGKVSIGSSGNTEVLRVNGDKVQTPDADEVDFNNAFKVSEIQSGAKVAAKVSEFDIKSTDGSTRYFKTSSQGTIVNTRLDVIEPDTENDLRLKGDGFEVNVYDSEHERHNRIKLTAGGDIHITHEALDANDVISTACGIEIEGRGEVADEGHIHLGAGNGISITGDTLDRTAKDEEGHLSVRASNTSIAIGEADSGDYIEADGGFSIAHGKITGVESGEGHIIADAESSIASGVVLRQDEDYTTCFESGSDNKICASGDAAVALGHTEYGAIDASGRASFAMGSGVLASGDFSEAHGLFAFTLGKGSHAEGFGVIAHGIGSHVEGYGVLFSHDIIQVPSTNSYGIELKDYKEAREVWFLMQSSGVDFYLHFAHRVSLGGRHLIVDITGTISLLVDDSSYGLDDYWRYRDSGSVSGHKFYIVTPSVANSDIGTRVDVIVRNVAASQASHAEGKNTIASEKNSHAEGLVNVANGQNSHVEGHLNVTRAENSHVEGYRNEAWSKQAHAEGANNFAYGENSHVGGESSYAIGKDAVAEGRNLVASGHASHAEGRGYQFDSSAADSIEIRGIANGVYQDPDDDKEYSGTWFGVTSVSDFRKGNVIFDNNSRIGIVRCVDTVNNRIFVSSLGGYGFSDSDYYVVRSTGAFGDYSHIEGRTTEAYGQDAHAEGYETIASGNHSHAEGDETIANGIGSHAEGHKTIASGAYQHVFGKYNIEDSGNTFAEIVGGGSDIRKNIRTLDWFGIESVNGVKTLDVSNQSSTKCFATDGTIQDIWSEYTAGDNIAISNGVISVTGISAISNAVIDSICVFD